MPYRALPSTYSTSQYQDKLQFNQPITDAVYFEHPFDGYALEGRILYNAKHDRPWVLSIHGARADATKSDSVSLPLRDRGYSVLSFNLSGHSAAGVLSPAATTLGNNVREAKAFFEYLDPTRPKVIIGYSLGGTPALKTLAQHLNEVDKLILFYPGIYTAEAYDKHFGAEFRETISRPYSYRDNDTVEVLRAFKGTLLLVKGEYDGLDPVAYGKPAGTSAGEVEIDGQMYSSPIPKEVIDMVYEAMPTGRRQYIEIPQCGHSVVQWLREHPTEAPRFIDQVESFLKK